MTVSHLRPRAKTTNARTMEHFRRWGLAERLRAVAPLKVAWSQDVVFCATLLGHEVMRFTDCLGLFPQRTDLVAEAGQQIAQPLVEEVLREAVGDLETCNSRLGWTLQPYNNVTMVCGRHSSMSGASSGWSRRPMLWGATAPAAWYAQLSARSYEGASDSRPNFGVVFRAPGLAERQPHGPAVHYWVLNPACPGVLGRMDLADQWWGIANGVSAEVGESDPLALIRGLVGAGIDAEVLGTDPWTARMLLADRYRCWARLPGG